MPIYEYQCEHCRYYLEVMQKVADAPLKKCPSCGRNELRKLISAPAFRLKGSGWYETDFKSEQDRKRGPTPAQESAESKPAAGEAAPAKTEGKGEAAAKPETKSAEKSEPKTESRAEPRITVPRAGVTAVRRPAAGSASGAARTERKAAAKPKRTRGGSKTRVRSKAGAAAKSRGRSKARSRSKARGASKARGRPTARAASQAGRKSGARAASRGRAGASRRPRTAGARGKRRGRR